MAGDKAAKISLAHGIAAGYWLSLGVGENSMPVRMTYAQSKRFVVEVDGFEIKLTKQQCRLCELLIMRRGIVTEDDTIEYLWPNPDNQADCSRNLIKVVVSRLRAFGVPIRTAHTMGYEIRPEDRAHKSTVSMRLSLPRRRNYGGQRRHPLNPPMPIMQKLPSAGHSGLGYAL